MNLYRLFMCCPIDYSVPELHFNNFDIFNNLLNLMELLRVTGDIETKCVKVQKSDQTND